MNAEYKGFGGMPCFDAVVTDNGKMFDHVMYDSSKVARCQENLQNSDLSSPGLSL